MPMIKDLPKNIVKILIRFYQFFFSFDHSFWSRFVSYRVCIYEPSCSEYTYQSIDKFGVVRGSILGMKRIISCNPFSHGGNDPVPDRFTLFKKKEK